MHIITKLNGLGNGIPEGGLPQGVKLTVLYRADDVMTVPQHLALASLKADLVPVDGLPGDLFAAGMVIGSCGIGKDTYVVIGEGEDTDKGILFAKDLESALGKHSPAEAKTKKTVKKKKPAAPKPAPVPVEVTAGAENPMPEPEDITGTKAEGEEGDDIPDVPAVHEFRKALAAIDEGIAQDWRYVLQAFQRSSHVVTLDTFLGLFMKSHTKGAEYNEKLAPHFKELKDIAGRIPEVRARMK